MYLSIKQHDQFRTLLMGFEIPFRSFVADVLVSKFTDANQFAAAMNAKKSALHASDPDFLRKNLPKACSGSNLLDMYAKFGSAFNPNEVVTNDIDIPMVGGLNLATFSLTSCFQDLYNLFGSYTDYCILAEKYRYARNKLDHPGCRTLEDSHLTPVLSFVRLLCSFFDDKYFVQKSKEALMNELNILQKNRTVIPIPIHNFQEMPISDSVIVCRDKEIEDIKCFIYGTVGALRKQHSLCIYGYGGVGKTALVLESLKRIIGDLIDNCTINEYVPQYILFFSAKNRTLSLAKETGKVIEKKIATHFSSAKELKELLFAHLKIESLRGFHDEGVVIIDNLETLSTEEKDQIKEFIDTQTPPEMQFIITSRNSEEYDVNHKLSVFSSIEEGSEFIRQYSEENDLELVLSAEEINELLSLSQGNTLVLVLCLRRISDNHTSLNEIKTDLTRSEKWAEIRQSLSKIPPTAFEVISQYMYKDTFEQLEKQFDANSDVFYKILKVLAVSENDGIDLSSLCLLTKNSYTEVEAIVDLLCNYLILEKHGDKYTINTFAEQYIIGRFAPDIVTYDKLSREIAKRKEETANDLAKLHDDMKRYPILSTIMNDWQILTDTDRIYAARIYSLFQTVKYRCKSSSMNAAKDAIQSSIEAVKEIEQITAHPYIKFEKASILKVIDNYKIYEVDHTEEIIKSFQDAIYAIRMISQYTVIQQTKSYAALLWLFGQYLYDNKEYEHAMHRLEESRAVYNQLSLSRKEKENYFKCISLLGTIYFEWFSNDTTARKGYLKKAKELSDILQNNWEYLNDKTKKHASSLKRQLRMLN